ncbi:MAG TPA: ABC transporter permease [Acidimicrobiia bacterium]|jgi:ABC-type nitrate/sulfonate/bicarbonate transport system permease component|nr:ABC transporter permease [Acidimicrobiia bacterium]
MGDHRLAPVAAPIGFAVAVLVLWQVVAQVTGADPRIIPAPLDVGTALLRQPGLLLGHATVTAAEMVLGFAMGAALGALIGVIVGSWVLARRALYPWLVASQTIPIPAVAAVLVIWFGFSILPKLFVVALITLFPVAVATADGFASVDNDLVRLMRSFGADERTITREVRIPAALPFVFSGAKVAAALAVLGAVFGEWVGARAGLGYLLLLEQRALDTDEVFAIIAVLSLLGIGFVALVSLLERLVIPWHVQHR